MAGPQTCNRGHFQSCFLWFIPSRSEFHSARYGSPRPGVKIQRSYAYAPSVGASSFHCKNLTRKVTSQEEGTAIPRTAEPSPTLSFCTLFIMQSTQLDGVGVGGGQESV